MSEYNLQFNTVLKDLIRTFDMSASLAEEYLSSARNIPESDQKIHKSHYYSFTVKLVDQAKDAEDIAALLSCLLERADAACDTDAVSKLGTVFEVYISYRKALEDFLTVSEQSIKKDTSRFCLSTVSHQTNILIRKINMLQKNLV